MGSSRRSHVPHPVICYEHELRVTAYWGDTIKRGRGKYGFANLRSPTEINHHAVVFDKGVDQDIVDCVAATFRAIGVSAENPSPCCSAEWTV